MKIGRNDLCPCGSGKKYKNCCYKKATPKNSFSVNGYHFDTIDENEEFFVNQKGAVVFLDETKQPHLQLDEGTTQKKVLSVGLSKNCKPLATIQENEGAICYILPNWYKDWCTTCVEMAKMGMNVFPSDVLFTKKGAIYAADIL